MSDKIKRINELAEMGVPGEVIAKMVSEQPITDGDRLNTAESIRKHTEDKNITFGKAFGLL